MNKKVLIKLFKRDFKRLKSEIESYNNEADLWIIRAEIKNSAGNLAIHLAGNLQHFIGHVLGKTDYVRDRTFELNCKDLSKVKIFETLEQAEKDVTSTLIKLKKSDFKKNFPIDVFDTGELSTGYFLLHLYGHFNYHLGQINYHRRLVINN